MPLCTLEIPREQYNSLPPDTRDKATTSLCNKILTRTIKGLGVPDPKDKEYRIIVNDDIKEASVCISYTCGGDEYGTGSIFNPEEKQVHATNLAIQKAIMRSPIKIAQTKIESWYNSAWLVCPSEEEEITKPPELENGVAGEIGQPKVRIILSPDMRQGISGSREGQPILETDPHQIVGQEINRFLNETLKPSESLSGKVEVVYAHRAQTNISVEVDFPQAGNIFKPEGGLYLTKRVEKVLKAHRLLGRKNASIWIRQGEPVTDTISPNPDIK